MRKGFYPKLAVDGIRKNKRMYLPYILTCIGMVMMYYIIVFLQTSETIALLPGSGTVQGMLKMGSDVIAVFAGCFLFYTNSFLLRRRKKEFGLYNLLGMGKRHIVVVLFCETWIVYLISVAAGLFGGIAFSKLAELGLVNVMRGQAAYSFSLSGKALVQSVEVFGVIFLILFLNALRQIRFSTALSLLRSENVGEKPPKANWFLGIAAIVILAAAYTIAVKIQDPISALLVFFAAVVLVIVGTYLLLISGSVMLCRILQKNKKYYYRADHFVSVSSMAYRMKRNGASLASVCILATMVLVMISSTASLYFGTEEILDRRYPRDINLDFRITAEDARDLTEKVDGLRRQIGEAAETSGVRQSEIQEYRQMSVAGLVTQNGAVETDQERAEDLMMLGLYGSVYQFDLIPLEDYNALTGANETLRSGECLVSGDKELFENGRLSFIGGRDLKIKKRISYESALSIQVITVVVPDLADAVATAQELMERCGEPTVLSWGYNFNTDIPKEEQYAFCRKIDETVGTGETAKAFGLVSYYSFARVNEETNQYAFSASFLYLGIVLSIVFVFAAVLIIYYKQISEGYEDQARFEIMRKVGMTKREIRKSINSQLLTVFSLPVLLAGVHLAFAFPIIQKLLLLFSLSHAELFAATTIGCFAVFAVCYGIVYRLTSNAYYRIVTEARGTETV